MPELSRRDVLVASAVLTAAASAPAWAADTATTPKTWNLTELYPTPEAWAAERQAVLDALPSITKYKGRLGDSAATLREALQTISDLGRRAARLDTYASLKADEDTQVAANQERRQLSIALSSQLDEATSWVDPELLSVGQAKIESFVAADPGLGKFRFGLENVLRRAPHTLNEDAERVLAQAGNPLGGVEQIRTQLVSSDIPWPEVTLSTGEKVRLDAQGYGKARQSPVRADRKLVMDTYFGTFQEYKSSLAQTLATKVNSDIFTAKARRYGSAVESALSSNNVPVAVYQTLIAETNAGLPVLHRYFEVRRKMLGLPDMHYYDIYPPATKIDRAFTLDEARTLTLAGVAPLGKEYVDTLAKATASPWADYYPRKGKASGAYMNPGAYDVHPFLLLNHTDDYNSVSTFAHEWGHAMHTVLANKAQPYETADYPIFLAEIASTMNEQLLSRYMQANAKTKAEKLFYLDQLMELFRGTFFRQAMFAEFELAMHDTVEKGGALSGEGLNEMYLALLKKYHGNAVIIDPVDAAEWAYIPHFYYNFYVYQYATSIAASAYFSEQVLAGGAKARDNYLNVLRAGGSDYPTDTLAKAGLDMTSPAPYRALVSKFSRTIDEVEKLMAT
ncbi:MAG: oligoendopeptidase F [Parcubacteria group bacterium]